MNILNTVRLKLSGILKAVNRFPVTFLLLCAIAVLNAFSIENGANYEKQIITMLFACFCFITAQSVCENIRGSNLLKAVPYFAAAAFTVLHYLLILPLESITMEAGIKTGVAAFALLIAFIWIPSIGGITDFNTSFMSIFKAFFTSLFFSGIIYGGVSLIIAAVDTLLVNVGSNVYTHTANIIWVVWAPMLFLSIIPVFSGNKASREEIDKASSAPRFLEVLLSFVFVPLASVYTVVLILYIIKTVFGGGWYDNYLEPLTISYCAAVLIIYVLLNKIENNFSKMFKLVFPKLLIFIALFQILSSFIVISSNGIIISRYFVLLFALYSVLTGILIWICPQKSGRNIAIFAIIFALVSITPKIDFLSVSAFSQSTVLKNALENNNMLTDGRIIPNSGIPDEDKNKIYESLSYLNQIEETSRLEFLPEGFDFYTGFETTFGFTPEIPGTSSDYINKYYTTDINSLEIGDYDYLSSFSFSSENIITNEELGTAAKYEENYRVLLTNTAHSSIINIVDSNNNELISVSILSIFESISKNEFNGSEKENNISADKMTFNFENQEAKIRIIFKQASIYGSVKELTQSADAYILYSIK